MTLPIMQDRRTPEQRQTHRVLVIATDKVLSGWGQSTGVYGRRMSFAAWACDSHKTALHVAAIVKLRTDMIRVRIITEPYTPGKTCAHLSIYVVTPTHPLHP